jgi:phage shock protein PspC (stress-responsive transcriptional regulator)
MQKVITINLNGNAYQLDERGYDALLAYLEQAERALAGNPDRAEIIADLEQAIADKCILTLGARRTVVDAAEVERILKEMGPVEGPSTSSADAGAATGAAAADGASAGAGGGSGDSGQRGRPESSAPRRLYLIREGAMIAGVCNGLAAYIGMDPTIVRILFVIFAVVTKGFGILAYGVLMFLIPSANTSEERAAAYGQAFNAQELIDRAKRQYADFRNSRWNGEWRGRWRGRRREWREWRRRARYSAAGWWPPAPVPPAGYAMRIGAGFMVPILSFLSAASFLAFAYVVISLLTRQEAFGEPLPADMPIWAGLLIAGLIYAAISIPIHAMQRASYFAVAGYYHGMVAAWGGLLSFGFTVAMVWLGYRYVPEVRELVQSLPLIWDSVQELAR